MILIRGYFNSAQNVAWTIVRNVLVSFGSSVSNNSLFFREYNDATSVNSRIRKKKNGAFVGNIWSKPILSSKSWIRISSSILPIGERGMNVVQTWGTLICVRDTHWHQGLNLYPTARTIQVAVSFNLRTTAAKAINSMITVKSGISRSYWEHTFKTNLLYVKNVVVHIYFGRHAFDCPSRSCIFCKIHDHCCEILLVFYHPIVKAGSRSTEYTVCREYSFQGRNRSWHNYAYLPCTYGFAASVESCTFTQTRT